MIDVIPVILCGGSGTRLWPLSRTGFPKQFLCITGTDSLFQQAAKRLSAVEDLDIAVARPLVVTNEEHRFLVTEQMRETKIELGAVVLEPFGRNTAPALTLAALAAQKEGKDPIMIVAPADQIISNVSKFTAAMRSAIREAEHNNIVILGIKPSQPETGYGYIHTQEQPLDSCPHKPLSVIGFKEKPNVTLAENYLQEGNHYWNAGIFVLKTSVWLQALQECRSDILQGTQVAWERRTNDEVFIRPDINAFRDIPSESIDYAVMEKLTSFMQVSKAPISVFMVPMEAEWSDLGSWDAVWNALQKDDNGNSLMGDVLAINSHNNLVHADSRLVSVVGVNKLVIIETPDAVLVAERSCSQDVKNIVEHLTKRKREEKSMHRKVHRPWGWYDSIDEGTRFKVKRIQVKPGASLSLQRHNHRAEHWIVVNGTAEIIKGEEVYILTENQSIYIPLGEVHRLSNPSATPLEIIEVQSGSYLGEDDIVRLADQYGRLQ